MARPFEHIVLPVCCSSCGHQNSASLAELTDKELSFACSYCGTDVSLDVREPAANFCRALEARFAGAVDIGAELRTVALDAPG